MIVVFFWLFSSVLKNLRHCHRQEWNSLHKWKTNSGNTHSWKNTTGRVEEDAIGRVDEWGKNVARELAWHFLVILLLSFRGVLLCKVPKLYKGTNFKRFVCYETSIFKRNRYSGKSSCIYMFIFTRPGSKIKNLSQVLKFLFVCYWHTDTVVTASYYLSFNLIQA